MSRLDRPRRNRVAGDQPAAADRDHQHVEVRRLLQHFERDGALPGDHMRIVIRMHPDELAFRCDRLGAHLRVRHRLAVQHHRCAIGFGRRDLHERRRHRHHDGRRNVQPLRMIGDRLRVIAGRHGNHAARAFGLAQRGQLGERAALLERVGDLQVLVFDPHLRAGERGELRRGQHRRAQHLAGDDAPRGLDVGQCDSHGALARLDDQFNGRICRRAKSDLNGLPVFISKKYRSHSLPRIPIVQILPTT